MADIPTGAVDDLLANLKLDRDLLATAHELGINLADALDRAMEREIAMVRARLWAAANAEAVASYNDYVGNFGMPLGIIRSL